MHLVTFLNIQQIKLAWQCSLLATEKIFYSWKIHRQEPCFSSWKVMTTLLVKKSLHISSFLETKLCKTLFHCTILRQWRKQMLGINIHFFLWRVWFMWPQMYTWCTKTTVKCLNWRSNWLAGSWFNWMSDVIGETQHQSLCNQPRCFEVFTLPMVVLLLDISVGWR